MEKNLLQGKIRHGVGLGKNQTWERWGHRKGWHGNYGTQTKKGLKKKIKQKIMAKGKGGTEAGRPAGSNLKKKKSCGY